MILGGFVAAAGVPLVALGVPLWVNGRKRELRLSPTVTASSHGAHLGVMMEF